MIKKFLLLITLISSLTHAQTKIPITMRLVEKGTTTGIPAGEKVVFYTPKGNDSLTTQSDGYINGVITDVKNEAALIQTTIRITREGKLEGTEKVKNAKLFNILGQQLADITQQIKLGKNILLQNLAAGIYFINIEEENGKKYTLKILQEEGLVYGSSVYNKATPTQITNRLAKTTLATVVDSIVVLDSYNVTRRKFDGFTTSANPINLGTKEVTAKTDANITVQNCDTDTNDAPAKITINGKEYTSLNGIFNLRIPKESNYTLIAQTLKKNGVINSFKRTINKTGTINDTLRVVDYYLRDINNVIVDSLDNPDPNKMSVDRFKQFMDYLHFNNFYNGVNGQPGGHFDHLLSGYAGNNDKQPDSIVVAKRFYNPYIQQYETMEQKTLDRIIKMHAENILPLVNIPLKIRETMDLSEMQTIRDYMLIRPDGQNNVFGNSSICGILPSRIVTGTASLRSGGPKYDPGDYFMDGTTIQEMYSAIFGYDTSFNNSSIARPDETIVQDNSSCLTPSLYDLKAVRTTTEKSYIRGEKIDLILGL